MMYWCGLEDSYLYNLILLVEQYPNGTVKIKTLKEPEYFISFRFDQFLADVVKKLMMTFNMSGL